MVKTTVGSLRAVAILIVAAVVSITPVHAQLERVGPVQSANGFPAWYQDKTGIATEFCTPLNATELDGGWCVLFTGDTVVPEVFPDQFADEHFYYAADAIDRRVPNPAVPGTTMLAFLRIGMEGAFLNGPVVRGDQMVFARLRIKLTPLPFDGTYTVYTPAGKFVFPDLLASDPRGLFFTNDVGLTAGVFTDALNGNVGPFLMASATPGGPEMAALTAANPTPDTDPAHFGGTFTPTPYPGTGKSYIADPARTGPVTGSTLPDYTLPNGETRNPNIFRIEGPNGFVFETTDFTLRARFFEGTIGGDIQVNRASYARSSAATKLDMYANASQTTQGRLPAGPAPATIVPILQFFDAACTGTPDPNNNNIPGPPFSAPASGASHTMSRTGHNYFGQSHPATIPLEVCVEQTNSVNAAGQTVPVFVPATPADEISITEALFDPSTHALSVRATSSDQLVTQTLTVDGFGNIGGSSGQLLAQQIAAAPSVVTVKSSGGGLNQMQVTTGGVAGGGGGGPLAENDTINISEDCSPNTSATACATPAIINVLANDSNVTGGTVHLVSNPINGTASVNANNTISYSPKLNANGADSFTYNVTSADGTQTSNAASVTINIAPVNDAPKANPDIMAATANIPTLLSVLANDTDPDSGDSLSVATVSAVSAAPGTLGTATATAAGGGVNFTATAAGSYTFSYTAKDAAGLPSNLATVTVTVSSAETLTIARAQFTASQGRYRVDGTIAPDTGQTINIDLLNSAGTVLRHDSVIEAAGAWAIDLKPITLPAGANTVRVRTSNGTQQTIALTVK